MIIWHSFYKKDAESLPDVIEAARERAHSALDFVERALSGKDYLLGAEFSAADIMFGFTLAVAKVLGVLELAGPRARRSLALAGPLIRA